jgi:putative membrane protein
MNGFRFTPEQHALVSAAVADAERATDGEIVTIVTGRSDAYHDVALHYAVGAMLVTAGLFAWFPWIVEDRLAWFHNGWATESDLPFALLLVMLAQGLIFLIVRFAFAWDPLRLFLTPPGTKARRARRRAVQLFKASAEKRTEGRVGILLFLSLDEHRAEIVADEAIHSLVAPERWGEAMAALIARIKDGDAAGGMAAAVGQIGTVLLAHFPKTTTDTNELPDRLIEL